MVLAMHVKTILLILCASSTSFGCSSKLGRSNLGDPASVGTGGDTSEDKAALATDDLQVFCGQPPKIALLSNAEKQGRLTSEMLVLCEESNSLIVICRNPDSRTDVKTPFYIFTSHGMTVQLNQGQENVEKKIPFVRNVAVFCSGPNSDLTWPTPLKAGEALRMFNKRRNPWPFFGVKRGR